MMFPAADTLAKDPVFQLNVLLWTLLPSAG
ncbi:MAG: hypothetical protein KatS3mg011_1445 [Acidimicrobiia bacterium]|nr:MAG: hypothetical protein KatS3mg011_1445 [Acidimicrobiia bacterium]